MDDTEARDRVARIEGLLGEIETLADPVARDRATETVQALLDLYGEGLARVLSAVGEERAHAAAEDELVAHLLFLHGIHPVPVAVRVQNALEEVRPYLGSHGGNVELLGVDDGVVRLRLEGSCSGCPVLGGDAEARDRGGDLQGRARCRGGRGRGPGRRARAGRLGHPAADRPGRPERRGADSRPTGTEPAGPRPAACRSSRAAGR